MSLKYHLLSAILYFIPLLWSFSTSGQPLSQFRGGSPRWGVQSGPDFNFITGSKWKFKTGGAVRSSPIYHEGKLYVGSSDHFLYCLDAATGLQLWSFKASSAVHSSPAVQGNAVYFTDKRNILYALEIKKGQLSWKTDLKADLPYDWGFDYYQSSPAIQDGNVYIGSGSGYMYALNSKDGKIKWSFQAASMVRSSPTWHENAIYFGDMSGKVYALNASTGEKKWQFNTEGDTVRNELLGNDFKAVIASVAVKNGVVVIGGRDGFLYGLREQTGKEIWRYSYDGSWVITSVAISNNTVITGTSDARWVQAFDLQSGKEKWKFKTAASVWASPIVVNNTVVSAVNDGFLYGLGLNDGKEKFRYRFGNRSALSSPTYRDGVIYIGNDDGFVSGLSTGNRASSGRVIKKAVFWTSDVMGQYVKQGITNLIRDYFVAEGYELLNEGNLSDFLKANGSPDVASVVFFAAGYIPEQVLAGAYQSSILYNYLKGGGKVVVWGVNPVLHSFNFESKKYLGLNYLRCDSLIGVKYVYNDLRSNHGNYSGIVTETGKKWGLTENSPPAFNAVDTDQVTALAIDENGRATHWVKNYGHREGTGFVQLWLYTGNLHLMDEVKQITEYGIY